MSAPFRPTHEGKAREFQQLVAERLGLDKEKVIDMSIEVTVEGGERVAQVTWRGMGTVSLDDLEDILAQVGLLRTPDVIR